MVMMMMVVIVVFTHSDVVGADESKQTKTLEDVSWLEHQQELKVEVR